MMYYQANNHNTSFLSSNILLLRAYKKLIKSYCIQIINQPDCHFGKDIILYHGARRNKPLVGDFIWRV
jgi:hypothetical protein